MNTKKYFAIIKQMKVFNSRESFIIIVIYLLTFLFITKIMWQDKKTECESNRSPSRTWRKKPTSSLKC